MRGFPTGAHFSTPPIPPPDKSPESLKRSTRTSPPWLHKNQTSWAPFQASRLKTLIRGFRKREVNSHPHRCPGERKGSSRDNARCQYSLPSPPPRGLKLGGGLWDTPHEKDVPPTHPDMATRGCTAPYRERSPSARCPPNHPEGGHRGMPHPPSPKDSGRGESRDRKLGVG